MCKCTLLIDLCTPPMAMAVTIVAEGRGEKAGAIGQEAAKEMNGSCIGRKEKGTNGVLNIGFD